MNFLEKELRTIAARVSADATHVGRVCYVPVRDDAMGNSLVARLEFAPSTMLEKYDSIDVSILNVKCGTVDSAKLRFDDILGKKLPNVVGYMGPSPLVPNILKKDVDGEGDPNWRGYVPTDDDYEKIANAIASYFRVFAR